MITMIIAAWLAFEAYRYQQENESHRSPSERAIQLNPEDLKRPKRNPHVDPDDSTHFDANEPKNNGVDSTLNNSGNGI
jgi:hypothetical protein